MVNGRLSPRMRTPPPKPGCRSLVSSQKRPPRTLIRAVGADSIHLAGKLGAAAVSYRRMDRAPAKVWEKIGAISVIAGRRPVERVDESEGCEVSA
jgi:hypothetical protein